MRLSSMRFKGFVWPHNPRVYTVSFERNMAVHKVPFGRYRLQSLGMTRRVMKGEGEFVGEDAYRQFKRLASIFYEETPGTLVHPLWDAASAWFVSLELAQEPREDYVKYRFEFWEDFGGCQASLEQTGGGASGGTAVSAGSGEGAGGGSGGEQSVPPAAAGGTERAARWHTVIKGETLWSIARKYGATVAALTALNPQIKNPNLIYTGQKVRVA